MPSRPKTPPELETLAPDDAAALREFLTMSAVSTPVDTLPARLEESLALRMALRDERPG